MDALWGIYDTVCQFVGYASVTLAICVVIAAICSITTDWLRDKDRDHMIARRERERARVEQQVGSLEDLWRLPAGRGHR